MKNFFTFISYFISYVFCARYPLLVPPPLTCSKVQHFSPPLLSDSRQRHSQLGIRDTFPDHQGRCGNAVFHQRVVSHKRQNLVGKFQGGLEPLSLQSIVQTLKGGGKKENNIYI